MKNISLTLCIMISTGVYSQVGINTETPQRTFHINGSLQITNELNVGGDADTAGNAGNTGDILESSGSGTAPVWKTSTEIRGTVATAAYIQGTSALTINANSEAAVPGMTYSYRYLPEKPKPCCLPSRDMLSGLRPPMDKQHRVFLHYIKVG